MEKTIWPKKHLHVDSFECEHPVGHSMLAFQSVHPHLLRSCRRRWYRYLYPRTASAYAPRGIYFKIRTVTLVFIRIIFFFYFLNK